MGEGGGYKLYLCIYVFMYLCIYVFMVNNYLFSTLK